MEMLIANETKLNEVEIGSEIFTVTDKRILYSNGLNNTFIGINELRGGEVKDDSIIVNKFNLPKNGVIEFGIAFVISLFICIFYYELEKLWQILLSAFLWSFPVMFVIVVITVIAKNLTAKKEAKIVLHIIKTDNTFWLNQYYDLTYREKLNELTNNINNAVYK